MSLFDKLMQRFHSINGSTQADAGGQQPPQVQETNVSISESGYDTGYDDEDNEESEQLTESKADGDGSNSEEGGDNDSGESEGTDDADSSEQVFHGAQETPEFEDTVGQLESNITEYTQLVQQTIADGKLTTESVQAIEAEYAETGKLSDKSYEALAEAGFPKLFVDSYLRGQEAVSNSYVQSVISMSGGNEAFKQLCEHLAVEGTLDAFQEAVENRNSGAIRAFMKMAESGLRSKYGKPAQRSVSQNAMPASKPAVSANQIQPFTSRAEMVAAMNDPRYQRDAAYNRMVVARLRVSNI